MVPTRFFIAAGLVVVVAIGSASLFSSMTTTFTTYYSEIETTASFENNATILNPKSTPSSGHTHVNEERPISSSERLTFDTKNEYESSSSPSSSPSSFSSPQTTQKQKQTQTQTMLLTIATAPTTLSASMGFEGKTIPECCCSFCEIEEVNREIVFPLLKKVVETPFFSHFKIDLYSECELWEDAPLCKMKDCSVCECEEPPEWSFANVPEMPPTGPDCESIADDNVITAVDSNVVDGWEATMGGGGRSDLFFLMDDGDEDSGIIMGGVSDSAAQVVDLLKNPEGYTGYTGPSAEKVWSAIHSQNCFQKPTPSNSNINSNTDESESGKNNDDDDDDDLYCSLSPEQRLYNRFISGLHSSISLHIAHSYCLEMDPHQVGECRMWGPNDAVAYDRVLNHPDRVENLYVAFSLLLRAVVKAEFAIAAAVPVSDPVLEESLKYWQEFLLPELLALSQKAPATFDESALLNLDGGDENENSSLQRKQKRSELQRRFQELQSIMQCVGCDRCKLWGTLQTLGVGTALRILFHDPDTRNIIHLTRQEAVALVNTLERLSSSLVFAQEFRARKEENDLHFDNQKKDASCGT
jgi:ERO1-like protein alpha